MDGADLELFERSLRHATQQHTGAALDAALDDLGWRDALAVDPRAAVSLLFELQGAANATSSALDQALLHAAGAATADAGPGRATCVVLPALGSTLQPAVLDGGRLTVDGLGTASLAGSDSTLVLARSGDAEVAVTVSTGQLTLVPIRGLDPALGLLGVHADGVATDGTGADVLDVDGTGTAGGDWAAMAALAQVALGHELVGSARTMLALAREHALERIQFGQPISQFQAVRHRLADTLVAVEAADALLDAAWLDGSPGTAAMAKALAGRGARTAARHCQQVLAGIGFTTEHPLHLHIRRAFVLDEVFGSGRTLTRELGDNLLTSRQLPPLPLL